jgi:hypothetical protein
MSNENVERTLQLFHALALNGGTTFPSTFHNLTVAIRPFLLEVLIFSIFCETNSNVSFSILV